MRCLTRAWVSGALTEVEWDRALEAYRARIAEIAPRLPNALLRLTRDVSLHDGLIECVIWHPAKRRLRLSLVCGDVQSGYFLVQLTYDGAMLGGGRVDSLRRAAESRESESLYDEVDIEDDGRFSHRLLFSPREEVTIEFERFDMSISPRPDRRVDLLRKFSEEPPDPDEDFSPK